MFGFVEDITEFLERFRYYTRAQWTLRGLLVLSGLVALLPLWILVPTPLLGVPSLLALVLSALLPRGHVPTIFCVLVVIWALVVGAVGVGWLLPVTLGCLGVHWAGAATAVGPSFAPVDPAVWRKLAVPLVISAAAVPVAAVVVALLGLVTLPGSLVLVALAIGILLAAAAVALWPARTPVN